MGRHSPSSHAHSLVSKCWRLHLKVIMAITPLEVVCLLIRDIYVIFLMQKKAGKHTKISTYFHILELRVHLNSCLTFVRLSLHVCGIVMWRMKVILPFGIDRRSWALPEHFLSCGKRTHRLDFNQDLSSLSRLGFCCFVVLFSLSFGCSILVHFVVI